MFGWFGRQPDRRLGRARAGAGGLYGRGLEVCRANGRPDRFGEDQRAVRYLQRRQLGAWTASGRASLTVGGNQVVGARLAAVADVTGGAVIDTEARAAISAILDRLRQHGLIAS